MNPFPLAAYHTVVFLIVLFAQIRSEAASREESSQPARPKIGLVLSGGGALGVAHVGALKLPAGLVAGRNIMASLRQLTVPVRHIRSFNQLPIPFRAIASDFETRC